MEEEQFEHLFSENDFINSIVESKDPYSLQQVLLKKGLNISLSQAEQAKNRIDKFVKSKSLNDDELEQVSGALSNSTMKKIGRVVSRPTYYLGYGIGALPIVGIVCYNAVKGAIEGIRDSL